MQVCVRIQQMMQWQGTKFEKYGFILLVHFVGTVSNEPKEEVEEEEEGPLLKGSGGEVSLSIEETK